MNEYLGQRKLHIHFTEEEVAHFFVPQEGVIYCYVDGEPGQLTDVFSFYSLPSQVLNHPDHNTLRVAYSFHNVCQSYKTLNVSYEERLQ